MVEITDLQEDYKEILQSGELEKPEKPKKLNPLVQIIIWFVIFTLTFWSVAWLY